MRCSKCKKSVYALFPGELCRVCHELQPAEVESVPYESSAKKRAAKKRYYDANREQILATRRRNLARRALAKKLKQAEGRA